jgi:hypothetical protein
MAIAYRSTDPIVFTLIYNDGTSFGIGLPTTEGKWHKEFFYVPSKKIKGCKYRLKADNLGTIRLYKKHSEVWMRTISSDQPFVPMKPFGGISNVTEITI